MSQPAPDTDPQPTQNPVPVRLPSVARTDVTLETGNLTPLGLPTPSSQGTLDALNPGADAHQTRSPQTGDDETAPPLSAIAQRYRSLRPLGRGGLGEVFVALDGELNREVALKEIQARHDHHSDTRRRFLLEAEVTGRLEHPGVVPVYGLGRYADGRPFYAMRLIKGKTLTDALNQFHAADKPGRDAGERSLAFRNLLRRFLDVCNTVAFAHSKGVLHRDLKPDNIMLGPFGETLVIDWGLAKVLDRPADDSTNASPPAPGSSEQTAETGIAGTPSYMSPEQAEGRTSELTRTSDIHSLGAILYVLVTGRLAFPDKNVGTTLAKVRRGECLPPRQVNRAVPPALEAVCLKAMALLPQDRYASAEDLAADVDHWLADEPMTAFREPLTARVRRWGRRHRALVSSLAALVLTVMAALAVGLGLVNAEKNRTADAKRETESALVRSQKAEKSAAEQRGLALQTVKHVVNTIDGRLKNRPDLQVLRKELLNQAREGLSKVARAADTAGQIDHETVWVHFELGDIFLDIDGATSAAKEQYELAFALARQLADADPNNGLAQRDLSVAREKLGDVQLQLGNTQGALDAHRAGLALRQQLADADPNNAQAQRDLSVAHIKLGDVLHKVGNTKEAADAYRAGLVIRQKLADGDPKNSQAQRDLSVAHHKLGDVQVQLGNTQGASDAYRKSNEISQHLADADPRNAELQRDLSVSHNKLGDVQLQLGNIKAALDSYRAGLAISKQLVDADPKNAQVQRDLSLSHNKLGTLQLKLGNTKEAMDAYRAGLVLSQQLADADPRNAQAQRDLSVSHNRLGDVQFKLDKTKEALDSYRAGLVITQQLADADPRNAEAQRDLSISHDKLGNVQLQMGNTKEALNAYRAGLAVSQHLANADPSNAECQRDVSVSHNKLGNVQLRLGNTQEALDAYIAGLAIRQQLADADPRNAQAQRDLLVSFFNLGVVAQQTMEFTQAVAWYQKALEVPKRFSRPEFFAKEVLIVEAGLRFCRGAEMVLQERSAVRQLAAADRVPVLKAVIRAHIRRKSPEEAAAAADLLVENAKNPDDAFDAARGYALCVPLADEPGVKERFAVRAVALLKKAVEMGFKDIAQLKKDTDLDGLRDRADFKAVLKELEKPMPDEAK